MSAKINVLVGPAYSGKTTKAFGDLLEKAYHNPDKKFLVIVPEQSSSDVERYLVAESKKRFGRSGYLNIDVLGFSRLCYRIYSEQGKAAGNFIEEYEKNMVVRLAAGRVKTSLKIYKNSIDKTGFIDEMKSAISELIQFHISPEDLIVLTDNLKKDLRFSHLADKLSDMGLIYAEFLKVIGTSGSSLPEEKMRGVTNLLLSNVTSQSLDDTTIVFDDFRGFTPDQLRLIAAIGRRAKEMTFTLSMEKETMEGPAPKEFDIFYKSYDTWMRLQKVFFELGVQPEVVFLPRQNFDRPEETAFLEKSMFRFPIKTFDRKPQHVSFLHMDSSMSEAEWVVEDIRRRVMKSGERYRNFAVVTADKAGFFTYAQELFSRYEIPVFYDDSREFSANPFSESIQRVLEIVDRDFDYDSVFNFFRTGVFDAEARDIDLLDNFALRTGIRGRKMWENQILPFGKNGIISENEKETKARIDQVRLDFMNWIRPLANLSKGSHKVSEYLDALETMIGEEGLGLETKIFKACDLCQQEGRLTEANAYSRLYEKIIQIFDETRRFLGDVEMPLHEFSELLLSGISEIKIGVIPSTLDQVVVGDYTRTKLSGVKHLYMINCVDGTFPQKTSSGRILSDKDKRVLADTMKEVLPDKYLSPADSEEKSAELFSIYQCISESAQDVTFSYYTVNQEGTAVEPSYLLNRLRALFPKAELNHVSPIHDAGTVKSDRREFARLMRGAVDKIHESTDLGEDESFDEMLNWGATFALRMDGVEELEKLSPSLVYENKAGELSQETLKDMNLRLSISKVEKYSNCPYSYFLQYVLRLKEIETEEVNHMDFGIIAHGVLETTMNHVMEKYEGDLDLVTEEELDSIVAAKVEEAWKKNREEKEVNLDEDGLSDQIYQRLLDVCQTTAHVTKYQMGRGEFKPYKTEWNVKSEILARRPDGSTVPVTLDGVVDRVDTADTKDGLFVRIVDYKTGSKTFDPAEVKYGSTVQLTTYMGLVLQALGRTFKKDVEPAGMYYFRVKNPMIETKDSLSEEQDYQESLSKLYESMRMVGVSNDDPNPKPVEELGKSHPGENASESAGLKTASEDTSFKLQRPLHENLELHEKGMLTNGSKGGMKKSDVIDVGPGKGSFYSTASAAIPGEKIRELSDLSMDVIRAKAEEFLEGKVDKKPLVNKSVGRGRDACQYCNYKSICRYGAYAGKTVYVPKAKGTMIDRINEVLGDENA